MKYVLQALWHTFKKNHEVYIASIVMIASGIIHFIFWMPDGMTEEQLGPHLMFSVFIAPIAGGMFVWLGLMTLLVCIGFPIAYSIDFYNKYKKAYNNPNWKKDMENG